MQSIMCIDLCEDLLKAVASSPEQLLQCDTYSCGEGASRQAPLEDRVATSFPESELAGHREGEPVAGAAMKWRGLVRGCGEGLAVHP